MNCQRGAASGTSHHQSRQWEVTKIELEHSLNSCNFDLSSMKESCSFILSLKQYYVLLLSVRDHYLAPCNSILSCILRLIDT
jgi:hypothetical protein